ncbi:MAG: 3-deoxy-manno-octulosonate cytidylyltransferase [Gammaproteobacteria bacterium]|nr:3-deoxy-manno-octulosonate cytidylyltransferase [Gammaproteobacteria bacterium]
MHVVIPARYGSTRLPGKALADIGGEPLVCRVYRRAALSGAQSVTVATDDARIAAAVEAIGGAVVMTSAGHASGTDRLAEAADRLGFGDDEIIVNLQGDEPLMTPGLLDAVAEALAAQSAWSLATAAHPITDPAEFHNPHAVKVVCGDDGRALYFSRSPIPYPRTQAAGPLGLRHIGLYAYRVRFLRAFRDMGVSALEEREGLEQLRALAAGVGIGVVITDEMPLPGVDTPEDLARVRALWGSR